MSGCRVNSDITLDLKTQISFNTTVVLVNNLNFFCKDFICRTSVNTKLSAKNHTYPTEAGC